MRRAQIEKIDRVLRERDEESFDLTPDPNWIAKRNMRTRVVSPAERRQNEIQKRRSEFAEFVQKRLTMPKIETSKIFVNGKEGGVGFVAIDNADRHRKIVRSYFFGPKGY
jgi:hypothetical protein